MKKKIIGIVILSLILSMVLAMMASATTTGYVTNGLVGFYDGSDNAKGSHNKNSTTWKDLSGKGNDFTVKLDSTNYWTNKAYRLESSKVMLPDALKNLINSNEFTVEIVLDNFTSKGRDFNPFLNCSNDMISIFRRISNDVFEVKLAGNARPVSDGGKALAYLGNQITITLTFKVGGESVLYINGEEIDAKGVGASLGIDDLFFGHPDATRDYKVDYMYLRFYDRVLSDAEITANYNKDLVDNPSTGDNSILISLFISMLLLASLYQIAKKRAIN